MIKKAQILLILLNFSGFAYSQVFQGGVLAGFNGTQVEGDNMKGYHKPGLLVGAYVRTDITPSIFGAMEIKYSQKGSRKRVNPKKPEPKYVMRLGYIDIPFYMGFRTGNNSAIIAGASVGYLAYANEYDNYGEFPPQDQHEFNKIDLQPFGGFQFDFTEKIKVDLRVALSVLPIRNHPGENATTSYWLNNQFNNVISLAVYYRIERARF